ncbi:MAG: AAA family ATPase, partial [Thermoplasmata archaeon]|nr:AAA family ATPase [Thermoplasmata archaeon]
IVLDNFKSFGHLDLDLSGPKGVPKPYVMIYGENGSGKTNIMESIQFLRRSTDTLSGGNARSDRKKDPQLIADGSVIIDPRLNGILSRFIEVVSEAAESDAVRQDICSLAREYRMIGSEGHITAEFAFVVDGGEVSYKMRFGEDERLIGEEMRCSINGRRSHLYSVSSNDGGKVVLKTHRSFFRSPDYESEARGLVSRYWGMHSLLSIIRSETSRYNRAFMEESLCPEILGALGYLDSLSVCLNKSYDGPINLEGGFAPAEARKVLDAYQVAASKFFGCTYTDIRGVHYDYRDNGDMIRYMLYFEKRINDEYRDIPAHKESLGTRNLLKLLPFLMEYSRGNVVFIDELDTGIHDKLVRDTMKQILESGKGQLIVTSHNTSLLRNANPSNAYVIRYIDDGAKEVVPISSIAKTQKNHNNADRYMNGVFDGVPYVSYIDMEDIVESFDEVAGDA